MLVASRSNYSCFVPVRTWEELSQRLRNLVADSFLPGTQQCLKNRTLAILDRMLQTDIIPLMGGVELVRYATLLPPGNDSATYNRSLSGKDEWVWQVFDRITELCRSHVIRLRVQQEEGRGRHAYKHLFPLMMMAFMKMLVVMVPLGFQFMAVVSGKALLLSKMALALASAQAMKRVTSAWFDVYNSPHPSYYQHVHRSYHPQRGPTHVNLLHTPSLPHHIQGFQPTLDVSHFSTWTHPSPDTSHLSYHQDPALGHITQLDNHNTASQEFLFTNTDHKPIHYPPVPSVFDTPSGDAVDRVDNQYINGKMKHNQHSRSKNL